MLKNKITIISSDNLLFTNAILLFLNTIIHSLELYNVFPYLLLSMLLMCVLEIIFLFNCKYIKTKSIIISITIYLLLNISYLIYFIIYVH
jgi:hypothetical protein